MSTTQYRTKYEIVFGPEDDEIMTYIHFRNRKTVEVNLKFDVSASAFGSGRTDELLEIQDLKLTGLDTETQYPLEDWLTLRGSCITSFDDERGTCICNFEAYYNPKGRKGEIAFAIIG